MERHSTKNFLTDFRKLPTFIQYERSTVKQKEQINALFANQLNKRRRKDKRAGLSGMESPTIGIGNLIAQFRGKN